MSYYNYAKKFNDSICKNDINSPISHIIFIPYDDYDILCETEVDEYCRISWCFDIFKLRDQFYNYNNYINPYTNEPFNKFEIKYIFSKFEEFNNYLISTFEIYDFSKHISFNDFEKITSKNYNSQTGELKGIDSKDFQILEKLGEGSFGLVNKALFKNNGKIYALKLVSNFSYIENEVNIYMKIGCGIYTKTCHPNIMKCYGWFKSIGGIYALILEYIDGIDFNSLLNIEKKEYQKIYNNSDNYLTKKYLYYFLQIVDTVNWLHSAGVTHLDIKPQNIMIQLNNNLSSDSIFNYWKNDRIVLFDFGLSIDKTENIRKMSGTPKYISKEIATNILKPDILDENNKIILDNVIPYNYKTDIWALGVLLYVLLNENHISPFDGDSTKSISKQIIELNYDKTIIPKRYISIIEDFFEDPDKRIVLRDVYFLIKNIR